MRNEVTDAFDFMCFGFETFATARAVLLLLLKTGLENEIYKIQELFFLLDTVPAACTTCRPCSEFLLGHQRAAALKKMLTVVKSTLISDFYSLPTLIKVD